MADPGYLNCGLAAMIEEDTVVATAEAEAGFRLLEFLHITSSAGQISVDAMENLNCGIPIDGSEIGARLR